MMLLERRNIQTGLVQCPTIDLFEYDEVGSTNTVLLSMAHQGCPVGTAVWAHRQTGGRGRLGRSFCSPEGGIYISILSPMPHGTSGRGFCLTAMAGVAVRRTISEVCGVNCGIKWVNDIILNGRKVAGILAQGADDRVVIGIGINYTTVRQDFPDELQDIACSVYDRPDGTPPASHFVEVLLRNLCLLCMGDEDENWLAEYKSSSTIVGNKVKIMQAGIVTGEGTAIEIDDSCFLHVVDDSGTETVLSTGEVSVRKEDD